MAVGLIVGPMALNFQAINPIAYWISVAAGIGLILYSLLTSYSMGARKLIPFATHLIFDFVAGLVFVLAPFLFGFQGLVSSYYWIVGAAIILVVLLTSSKTDQVWLKV